MVHLAIDCGGTKTLGLLYDAQFRPIRSFRVGSVRLTSTPPDAVEENIRQFLSNMTEDEKQDLGTVCGGVDRVLLRAMEKQCRVEHFANYGEFQTCLAAGDVYGDGMLMICGTGCQISANIGGKHFAFSAYGSLIDDEGSGYWLGRKAMQAAIRDYEGWGEHTALTEMLCQWFGKPDLRDAVYSVYGPNEDADLSSIVTDVAACAPLVCKAAYQGDAVALRILTGCAEDMGKCAAALIRRYSIAPDVPVVVAGSIWKGHPVFWEKLCRSVTDRRLIWPTYEPIAGAVRRHARESGFCLNEEEFKKAYCDFLFRKPW